MIHIFKEEDGTWQVWSDCEEGEYKLGRCIGTGKTRLDAINEAHAGLREDLAQVQLMMLFTDGSKDTPRHGHENDP